MSEEKPLHVRVALALGWTDVEETERWKSAVLVNPNLREEAWSGKRPLSDEERARWNAAKKRGGDILLPYQSGPHGPRFSIDRYDTDWSATGPLVEKYTIAMIGGVGYWLAYIPTPGHVDDCAVDVGVYHSGEGPTPLIAVCNLILELGKAGKL